MTALHWAAQHGHRDVAELLLKYGADVHSLSKFDKTPFDIAMDTSNTELMILLQVKGLCVLFLYGSDVHLFSRKCPYVCIRREVNTRENHLNTCKYVFLSLVYVTRVETLKVELFPSMWEELCLFLLDNIFKVCFVYVHRMACRTK